MEKKIHVVQLRMKAEFLKLYSQFGTRYTKSMASIYALVELVILLNILINEKQLKTHEHKAHGFFFMASCCPAAALIGWQRTSLQANIMLQTATVELQRGCIDFCDSQGAYSLFTLHLHCKQRKKRAKHTALLLLDGLQTFLNHRQLWQRRAENVLWAALSGLFLWLIMQ